MPSVRALESRAYRRQVTSAGVFLVLILLIVLLLRKLDFPFNLAIAVVALLPALLVWLWRSPVRGVYTLFFLAVFQETQYDAVVYPDDIGHYFPFFQDFATWTHISGLSFSLAELFMLLMILIWVLKGIAERTLRFDPGSLMLPMGLYLATVLFGELHGLASGGTFKISLWEVRSQVYMLIAYVLAANLIRTRRHVDTVVWLLLLGAGIKGVQGTWRFFYSLHGSTSGAEAIFPHEQSYFFNALLTLTPILFLFRGSPRMRRVALLLAPFALIANLANQRRAALLALAIALALVLLLTWLANPARRGLVTRILLFLAVALPPYFLYYNGKSGLLAEPARAVSSIFSPDPRDASSNAYRIDEDRDILATMRTSPVIGFGYGRPMLTPYPLADISGVYIFWNIMPHDSLLWIWMRLGAIGFLAFWLLIGSSIIQGVRLACRLPDLYMRGIALLIVALVVQEVIVGRLDLQLSNYRNLIALGVLLALLSKLGAAAAQAPSAHEDKPLPQRRAVAGRTREMAADRLARELAG